MWSDCKIGRPFSDISAYFSDRFVAEQPSLKAPLSDPEMQTGVRILSPDSSSSTSGGRLIRRIGAIFTE